jgi:hypothetical protein
MLVVKNALIILNPDQIIALGSLKPRAIDLHALFVAPAPLARRLIVDHRNTHADGKIGARRLDGLTSAAMSFKQIRLNRV